MTLKTPWSNAVDLENPLCEYPRMQMQRGSFTSLNGVWEFQITDGSQPIILGGWEEMCSGCGGSLNTMPKRR